MDFQLTPIEQAIELYKKGSMLIMVDDESRENEGDLILATECLTTEAVGFMLREGRGLICVSISVDIAERLNLPLQTLSNNSVFHTPFTVSIDHVSAKNLGASAEGRVLTMRKLVDPNVSAAEFVSPGQVFPLIANPAGTLGRRGQTEGSADLARLAGFSTSSILCEILNPDGTMARGKDLAEFASKHNLPIISVADLVRYRVSKEVHVRMVREVDFSEEIKSGKAYFFIDDADKKEHVAVVIGELPFKNPPLVRVHSECLTGDVLDSRRCDCGPQLHKAIELMKQAGEGVVVYLRQEGRGIGLTNKLKAYALQDGGLDTVEANIRLGFEADTREFAVAARLLEYLGIKRLKLFTNNPRKISGLQECGIDVIERVPLVTNPDPLNASYLQAKREKLGHLL